MKKTKHTEEKIIGAVKQLEAGRPVAVGLGCAMASKSIVPASHRLSQVPYPLKDRNGCCSKRVLTACASILISAQAGNMISLSLSCCGKDHF